MKLESIVMGVILISIVMLLSLIITAAPIIQEPPNVIIANSQIIPSDYYNQSNILPPKIDIISYMETFKWEMIEMNYSEGNFDCSQMSAYWEFVLENSGYNTTICYDNNHSWILVEINETTTLAYETTTCYWINTNKNHEYYSPKYIYDSIYEIHDDYGTDEQTFLEECAWWNSI